MKRHKRSQRAPGTPPGTILATPGAPAPRVRLIGYSDSAHEEREIAAVDEIAASLAKWPTVWINVDGLGDGKLLEQLGQMFKLHPLALEDVSHTDQRPKIEEYDDYIFLVCRMAVLEERVRTEQISIFVGEKVVLTFHEHPGDCFDVVRQRIREGGRRICRCGTDYLLYALLDALLDSFFPLLERLGEGLEQLENELLARPDRDALSRIQDARASLLTLRRVCFPHREILNVLMREENAVIHEETRVYLRDCYDHAALLIDLLESYREVGSNLMEVYLSALSFRMNEVMKVLTIIATIFIPLGFIAGVYGMNFDTTRSPWNMPELHWVWGYPFALGLMAAVAGGLLLYFKRKGWLGGS